MRGTPGRPTGHEVTGSPETTISGGQLAAVVAVAIATIAGVAIGLNTLSTPPSPPSGAAASASAASTSPSPADPSRAGVARPADAPGAPPAEAPPAEPVADAPASHPEQAEEQRSVEDLVARAMDAVVLVETPQSRGTAFYVTPDTLLTNVHVVGHNSSVRLRRADGRPIDARVSTTAAAFDLAILKVAPADRSHTTLPLGSGLNARVGQDVIAIGSALGTLQNTVTRGIVSAVRRSGDAVLVQTDAAVNPGNSGGPLLDRRGEVVGITTMGYVDRQGLNFAVAIEHARPLLEGRLTGPLLAGGSATGTLTPSSATEVSGLNPAIASDTDQARTAGAQAYDRSLKDASGRADRLDDDWRKYRKTCGVPPLPTRGSREWFGLLDNRLAAAAAAPACLDWFSDIRDEAGRIDAAVQQADEHARRADVFPGARRDLRRQHHLDFDGWDR